MAVLTRRQGQFVVEYLKDLNGAQAAIRAGYSVHSAKDIAYQLLNRPAVAEAVEVAIGRRAERVEVTTDYVLASIQRVAERCEQTEPVLDEQGRPIGVYRFESASALRGYELLGKHLSMFKDQVEISDLRTKSDADIEAEITALDVKLASDASDLV